MDVQQYISSGIIETYVLGLASEQEAQEIEQLRKQYPEINAAVEACRETLEDHARLYAIVPPEGLKEKIRVAIERRKENVSPERDTTPVVVPMVNGKEKEKNIGKDRWWKYLAAAAVILLIGSVAMNLIYIGKYQDYKARYDELQLAQHTIIVQNNTYKASLEQYETDLHMMMDPSMKPVMLQGVPQHPDMKAMVLWDTRSKEVYLALNNLPAPPADKQYQLWAIVDGKPVDAGLYNMSGSNRLQKMKVIGKAQMFAITLEKKGGSPVPTMDQLFVAGKVI